MNLSFLPLRQLVLVLAWAASFASAGETLLKDDFSNPKLEQRRASRGDWKFADGVATCRQDDALFKKFKDHGPIIVYDLPFQDARIRFSFKAEAAKTLVFTANGAEGHVFRFVMSERGTSVRAFPTDNADHQSIALANEAQVLKSGEWVTAEVDLRGTKATMKIGDLVKTYEHASLARPKANISIGFSFGTLSVKDVVVEK